METQTEIKTKVMKPLAVVTGASSGIGLELAKQFAQNNFDLLIAAENAEIHEVAEQLKAMGANVEAVQVDLATLDGNQMLYERIRAYSPQVEVLALNAGVGVHGDFVRENEIEPHLNLINLNVVSPVFLSKKIAKDMMNVGHGKILFTSSIASLMPGTEMATYNASKAFVESFAQAIREELKDSNVTITTLLPGATETNFFARAGAQNTAVGSGDKDDPADVAKDGFNAVMAGEDHVVGGSMKNKFQEVMSKVLPDTVKAKLHHNKAKSQSKESRKSH